MSEKYLKQLEDESIFIIREAVSEFDNPVLLYSIGKDSSVLLNLAIKAFYPAKLPFPVLHVNTNWKFKEMIQFRNEAAKKYNFNLIEYINPYGIKNNINPIDHGSVRHTEVMKTEALKQVLDNYKFDAAFGGARRDEEKSRAKERKFSYRDKNHRWEPKSQRPELWEIYNCRLNKGECMRVFPLSNWSELDVWRYINYENIDVVPLYFAKRRPVVNRNNMLIMVDDDRFNVQPDEKVLYKKVRFRTLGCYPLTAAIMSDATSVKGIVKELESSTYSERQGRLIDFDDKASMEKKKVEGYF